MKAQRKPVSARHSLYAKISIAQKQLGLDEDIFRGLLESRYGVRSRKQMSDAQLVDLVGHFEAQGFRPKPRSGNPKGAGRREHGKMRALWLSLYHLGVVHDPSDAALAAFAKRVTGGKQSGVDALAWIAGEDAFAVIEALKDWASRDGGVNWEPYASTNGPFHNERCRVIEAQWRKLHALGAVRIDDRGALDRWACRALGIASHSSITHFDAAQLDTLIRQFGEMIRRRMPEERS
ncbi:regulatory protein GemA [Tepidicaulis sp. LMO-SS28]|uniref:regulatory protein GemA n=1 Tax=Tepidicaulis sp. LMO-SS28 TaxID=3447455 RepID=UPI003EDF34C7